MKLDRCAFAITLSLVISLYTISVNGQVLEAQEQVFRAPSELVLLTVAMQDGCPVKIDNAEAFVGIESGKVRTTYKLRNISAGKFVKSIVLSEWHVGGGGGDLATIHIGNRDLLAPGAVLTIGLSQETDTVPKTDKMTRDLGLSEGELATAIVLFVKEVRFSDGSRYTDQRLLEKFMNFSNRIELVK